MSKHERISLKTEETIDEDYENILEDDQDKDHFEACFTDLISTNTAQDMLQRGEDGKIYIGPFDVDYIEERMQACIWSLPYQIDMGEITDYF